MDATDGAATSSEMRPDESLPARFWISLALLAAVIFFYVLLMSNRTREPQGTTGPAIGRRLGYLQLEPLTGDAAPRSPDDLQGHVTLINFWGTWCPPCIRELPQIVEISKQFADREGFQLLAVSCGQGSDAELGPLREETETFLKAREVTLPTYADQNGATRQAMSLLLNVPMGYPTTLVLDREGVIRGFWQGYDSYAGDEMAQLIDQLLNQH